MNVCLKKTIKSYPKIDIEKIKKKIDRYEYVSFDIFDTLLKRNVESPCDVFKLVQMKFEIEIGKKIDEFKEIRKNSEKKARLESDKEEINLVDIYKKVEEFILDRESVEKWSRQDIETLMNMELIVEKEVCCPNKEIKEIFTWCKEKGKKIIIISDMYLPLKFIEELLEDNGFYGYEKLFLSSDIGLKKSTGNLFNYVASSININNKSIVHIGDSIKSDYIKCRKAKWRNILIPKYINHLDYNTLNNIIDRDKFSFNCIKSLVNNNINMDKDEYFKFGYESFGLLLYGFNKWMVDDLKKRGIKKVYFFSRDGHVIKKVFDLLYSDCGIESHYLYVSRRSLRVPQLWIKPELQDVVNVFPLAKVLNIETMLKNLGLNPIEYVDKLANYELKLDDLIKRNEILTNKKIIAFYNSIKKDVIKNSKDECKLLLEYFKQNNFCGNVAVVDIGWHGTLQHFIKELSDHTDLDVNMSGYYIGLASEAKRYLDIKGYVVDKNSLNESCDSWKSFNGLVETLFLAQEGSTEKFKKDDSGNIVPVLYKYEYINNDEFEPEAIKVKSIQDGAVEFAKHFKECDIMKYISFESSTAFRNIILTGNYPSKKYLNLFANFRFLEEQIDYLAMPKSIFIYIFKPKMLIKDMFLSRWKVGFMKKLFKLPLPYEKIYRVLKEI